MNVLIALIIFVIGGIVGFLATRLLSNTSQQQRSLSEQASKSEAALEQYKLDVAEHLSSSADLLSQMNNTCQIAMKQMQESTQLLQKATPSEIESMPFFAAETEQQLAQTATLRRKKKTVEEPDTMTEPPLDYSSNPSGLFADQKQTVTTSD